MAQNEENRNCCRIKRHLTETVGAQAKRVALGNNLDSENREDENFSRKMSQGNLKIQKIGIILGNFRYNGRNGTNGEKEP